MQLQREKLHRKIKNFVYKAIENRHTGLEGEGGLVEGANDSGALAESIMFIRKERR